MFSNTSWHLFTFRGHPVHLAPSFLIVVALFVGMGMESASNPLYGLLWLPVLFVSILLHEFGHAFATDAFGYGKSRIVFQGMGGVAISRGGARSPKKAIGVSLAGPAVSALLAAASGGALFALTGSLVSAAGPLEMFLYIMFQANVFWTVFNLLPIYPMDGGQATYHALEMWKKDRAAVLRTTAYISLGTIALALIFAVKVIGLSTFTIIFAAYFAYINVQMLRSGRPVRLA